LTGTSDLNIQWAISIKITSNIQGVDKIMGTLRNCGIEFVLATVKELQLATPDVLLFVYTL
jgi:hypothetical protein